MASTTFIAQLCNQQVAHEILALQILVLLLEKPTDDSVEIAVSFMREVGAFLAETSPKANNGVYERFRAILHESGIDKRVQYMVEVLFQVRKDKYKDNPVIPEGLDLVEEEDGITHKVSLDDDLKMEEMLSKLFKLSNSMYCSSDWLLLLCFRLDVFKFDPNYAESEEHYKELKTEILGEESSAEESGDDGDEDDDSSDDEPDDGISKFWSSIFIPTRFLIFVFSFFFLFVVYRSRWNCRCTRSYSSKCSQSKKNYLSYNHVSTWLWRSCT